jgi:hypothetical protein
MTRFLRRPCPLGCGYPLSLWRTESGRSRARCFGGCDESEILAVEAWGEDDLPIVARPSRADDQQRIERARRDYQATKDDPAIGIYLRSRAIMISSSILHFSLSFPHRLGIAYPAMVAPVVDIAGEQTGVHATYLRPDFKGKVDLPKEYQRETRGVIGSSAIRLARHDPRYALLIGEGVETTLSAMQLFGLPGWSAINAGGLKTIDVPLEVRNIIVVADHDLSGRGPCNALMARDRWRAEDRRVKIAMPKRPGDDFNDVLQRWAE